MPSVPYQPGKSQELLDLANRYQSYGTCGGNGKTHQPQDCWMILDIRDKVRDTIIANDELSDKDRRVIFLKLGLEESAEAKMVPSAPSKDERKEPYTDRQVKPLEVSRLQGRATDGEQLLQTLYDCLLALEELDQWGLRHKNVNPSVMTWGMGKNKEVQGYLIDYDLHTSVDLKPAIASPLKATTIQPEDTVETCRAPHGAKDSEAAKRDEGSLVDEILKMTDRVLKYDH
ncbi:hypothetical protein FRB94_001856 [Tulasnella sp. JGI-2019a]|nr:hypothetical protein FRB94_001856 [Tulasnella sp. JGI-2019a]